MGETQTIQREPIQSIPRLPRWLNNITRIGTSLSLAATMAVEAVKPIFAQETPDQTYTTKLVGEINARRARMGLPAFGVSPTGRVIEAQIVTYLNDVAEGRNGITPPTDYVKNAGDVGEVRGLVVGLVDPPETSGYWEVDAARPADAWLVDGQSADVLYNNQSDANGITCGLSNANQFRFVGCATFRGPIVP